MKMMKNTLAALIAVSLLGACGGQQNTETEDVDGNTSADSTALSGTYEVAKDESAVMWEGTMLEIGGISLYSHNGTIGISEGSLEAVDGELVGGKITIDMTNIDPKDENYSDQDGGRSSDLVGHLSSDDFFNVAEHPTSTFEITKGANGMVEGHLTIRGIKKPVNIEDVEIMTMEDGSMHAKGNFTFDRQDYEVRFSMPVQEKVLSDNIKMSFDVKATKGMNA
jgi:polyisoprenoid-binding protein YceI